MSYGTLVDTDVLAAHLYDGSWLIADCRHDLADSAAGRAAYAAGHIPGAHFVHLDEALSGAKTGANGRHPLPDPHSLAVRMGGLGIGSDTQVVAYDAQGGMYAARLWWLLRWLGHDKVAVLNGGLTQWLSEGRPMNTEPPVPRTVRFDLKLRRLSVPVEEVSAALHTPHMLVVDARGADRYRGENETLDPVGGHIPGARNRFFKNNLGADGRFKTPELLKQEWQALLGGVAPEKIVHQCGSGVTACHNLLAMEAAGLHGSRLYAGSWSEWCADPARPVAKGEETRGA